MARAAREQAAADLDRRRAHRRARPRRPPPGQQGAALRARLNLDAIEPRLRETLAGLRHEVDGTADGGNALRSAVAARADQQAAPAHHRVGHAQHPHHARERRNPARNVRTGQGVGRESAAPWRGSLRGNA